MKIKCTGVILSGGANKRFSGHNKAFAKIGSSRIIDRIYNIFDVIFDDIIIVTNNPIDYVNFDCCITTDHYTVSSSLNGIHAGLFAAHSQHSFFIACDTPFANQRLIHFIVSKISKNKDIIIPKTSSGFEPLFAVYSKNCLKPITKQIEQRNLKISKLFNKVRVEALNEIDLKKEDPSLSSFVNINSPNDLIEAENYFKNLKETL